MKILIIEDNRNLANSIARALKWAKYSPEICQNGMEGHNYWIQHKKNIDLVILDEMLPWKNGITIIRDIRVLGISTPTIMLTAKAELKDKVAWLKSGCDDYMTKPFELDELLARIEALNRRPKERQKSKVEITKDILMDIIARQVLKNGKEITLTSKEFEILEYLIVNSWVALSESQIFDHCFDFARENTSNTVEVHIKNLRKKLFTNSPQDVIKTIRGTGYRFDRWV